MIPPALFDRKRALLAGFAVTAVYALAPFFAGLLVAGDPRGPRLFRESHHRMLYSAGYSLFHGDIPRPPYMRERPWIYGFIGKPIRDPRSFIGKPAAEFLEAAHLRLSDCRYVDEPPGILRELVFPEGKDGQLRVALEERPPLFSTESRWSPEVVLAARIGPIVSVK